MAQIQRRTNNIKKDTMHRMDPVAGLSHLSGFHLVVGSVDGSQSEVESFNLM